MIYCIGNLEANLCKIGYSNNPCRRFKAIQTGCPLPVRIYYQIEGNLVLEKLIHRLFKNFHKRGEWYEFSEEIRLYFHKVQKREDNKVMIDEEEL